MKKQNNNTARQTANSLSVLILILYSTTAFSQGVAISNSASNAPAAGSMLHVYGTTRIGSENSADGVLIFNNATNAKTVTISPGATGISYGLVLPPVQAAAPDYVLINDGDGNLSWGPQQNTAWQLLGNSGTNASFNYLGTNDAQPLRIVTNGSERLRITSSGNIGIGTENPASNLI